jgi:hypothetical protein
MAGAEMDAAEQSAEHLRQFNERKWLSETMANPGDILKIEKAIEALTDPTAIGTLHRRNDYTLIDLINKALDHKKALMIVDSLRFSQYLDFTPQETREGAINRGNLTVYSLMHELDPLGDPWGAEELKDYVSQYDNLVDPDLNTALNEIEALWAGGSEDWTPSDTTKQLVDSTKDWAINEARKQVSNIEAIGSMPEKFVDETARPFYDAHKDEIHEAALISAKEHGIAIKQAPDQK